jgi:opacity protein-like surface antigen
MRRIGKALFPILLAAGAVAAAAQVVPSATGRQVSLSVGGMASAFQPDFAGEWQYPCTPDSCYPAAQGSQALFGAGAYVDLKLNRWLQVEAEGRWQRWHQYAGIHQDNYLIGPKLPLRRFGRATVYGKTLFGFSRMDFGYFSGYGHGNFSDFAFGGGMDVKLTKRLTLRPVDFEYQYWPWWGNSSISPYGASVGVSYKIF